MVEALAPGSFRGSEDLTAQLQDPDRRRVLLTYFSLVTLTTLGYGDIVPATNAVRGVATVEAVVGQFYLGVFIALLLGIRVAQILAGPGKRDERDAPEHAGRGRPAEDETVDSPTER
jgi:hypothetical protein